MLQWHMHYPKAVITPCCRCCTCFAAGGPDPSATVTGISMGNFRSTGTNVKVKGAPAESWRKEKWPVRHPHITRNNPQLIGSKHVSVFTSRQGHDSREGILPRHYTDHVIRRPAAAQRGVLRIIKLMFAAVSGSVWRYWSDSVAK